MAKLDASRRAGGLLACTFLTAAALLAGCGGSESGGHRATGAAAQPAQLAARTGMLVGTAAGHFVLPWESTFGGALGDGFNSVTEEVQQSSCIDFDTETVGDVTNDFEFDVFDSIEDLALSINASYSTASNYGIYKNSLTADVMSKLSMSSNTVYAHARHRVTGRSTTLKNVRLKDAYKALSARDFVDQCGDYYLGNYSSGAALDAILTITASTLEEKLSIKTDLSNKVARSKIDVSTQTDLEKYVAEKNASIHILSRGCVAISVQEPTLAAFYQASEAFYQSVNDCLADPAKGSMTDQMTFYSLAPYVRGLGSLLEAGRKARDDLLFTRTEYLKLASDIQDILRDKDNRLLYDWTDPTKYDAQGLTNALAVIGNETARTGVLGRRILPAINVCENSAFDCVFPSLDPNNQYGAIRGKLPKHLAFYPGSCSEIYRANQAVTSGPQYIYLGNNAARKLQVYCRFDAGGQLDYLELNDFDDVSSPSDSRFFQPTDSRNFAQSIGQFQLNAYDEDQTNEPDVVTSFRKFRILPRQNTVEIDLNDSTFATTYTNPTNPTRIPEPPGMMPWQYFMPVGCAQGGLTSTDNRDPNNPYLFLDVTKATWMTVTSIPGWTGSGWGRARVDVSMHPLRISNRTQWQPQGYEAQGYTVFGTGRKSVDIFGRGWMGGICPLLIDGTASRTTIELEYVDAP